MHDSDTQFPVNSPSHGRSHNQEIVNSRNINNIINSIPSARRRTRLQTAAYLIGSRKELPEINDEEITRIRAIHLCTRDTPEATSNTEEQEVSGPMRPQAFNEKVEFCVPLDTTDTNKSTTYVDHFYTESDHPQDIFDSMRATMNLPKAYEHLGWRLSTARRTDPPHRLLTTQDIASAFKAVRAEQASGRKKKKVVIEIVNTMPVLKGKPIKSQAGMVPDPSLLLYTKELENVKNKLCCYEHQLGDSQDTFCWVDVSQLNTPHYPMCTQDLQEWAKYLYDTRDPDNTCINLPSTPHFENICKTRKARTASSLQRVPTELMSPVIHNHVHLSSTIDDMWASNGALSGQQSNGPIMVPQPLKRTFALYMESDEETDDDEPPQDIEDILTAIHSRYPAMDFPRYVHPLKEHGILYLPTAAHFGSKFYVEKVGMSEGAAFTFRTRVCQAHMKEERAKARRKAKGKKKATRADDTEKENTFSNTYHSMLSSPVISTSPAGVDHCVAVFGSPADIFAKRSVQDDTHATIRPHNPKSCSRVMEPIDSNQRSFEETFRASVPTIQSLPNGLPPASRHMSFYARRASLKFKPYQLGGRTLTALEHRFTMKSLLKRNETDINMMDVHQGKEIFQNGLRSMPDASIYTAIIAKRADAESKRLQALATAWELESAEKHAILLQTILRDCAQQYVDSNAEASFFERTLVRRTMEQLEDDADFSVAAYSHDLAAYQIADVQLRHVEEVGSERKLPIEDIELEDAEYRLGECVDSILAEADDQIAPIQRVEKPNRPKPIVPCKPSSGYNTRASISRPPSPSATDLDHFLSGQQPKEPDHAHDNGFNNTSCSQTDALLKPSHPLGRIPKHFEHVPLSEEDANYSDTVDAPPARNADPPEYRIQRVLLRLRDALQTSFNCLGLCRLYPRRPSFEPDKFMPSSLLSTTCPTVTQESDSQAGILPPPYPFTNMTIYRLMSWMNSGSNQKSETETTRLVKEVLLAGDFDTKHLEDFSVRKSLRELDNDPGGKKIEFLDDWMQADVTIQIPTKLREDEAIPFTVSGLHFRPLIEVIRSAFTDIQASAFHLSPFKRLWRDPLDNRQERIYNELYTSDSWMDAQDEVQKLPREPGCMLERVVAGLMLFSDATHLANFGTAKAWPLYMYFGNLTKYARSAPKSGACHLVGFLPSLPDRVKDVLSNLPRISKSGIAALHTHCRRELFHACWDILLDKEFLHAYRHGIVLKCADGVFRRVFPRIFTYSADYPEKVLIATIKDMGSCPCPRCLTPKSMFASLGLLKDMKSRTNNFRVYVETNIIKAREYIYKLGNTVDVPAQTSNLQNRFVQKLGKLGLDPFRMLVVDFMHECELGTWKALFTHLVRILYALPAGEKLVATLDSRFRQVPTFGNGVIRIFANNTSEMKRLATRDFEDILQCAIPVFEGLFPAPHDAVVQSLLYKFAQWHALAKLRIHSESTLGFLNETFKNLSRQLRRFRNFTCAVFDTVELPKEKAARQQRLAQCAGLTNTSSESSGPRVKSFNLSTYKFHAMGDYVRTIKLFGTTDSFTTQIGELAHRALKAFYPLTSKLETPKQLAKHERRRRVLRRVTEAGGSISSSDGSPADTPAPLENDGDPVVKNFIPKLKDHILYRLKKLNVSYCDYIFTDEERNTVIIPNNTLYLVQTMQVHYTTYDMRREYDTINPKTHADVMVFSGESTPSHPYWYTRVIGIYHVDTWLQGGGRTKKHHLDILHVRWLAPLISYQSGMHRSRLPKVAFVEESDHDAFGFLDPGQVIRGAHLIPAFASGRGVSSLRYGKSLARPRGELDDWEVYYVGIFVDRDMFLRYTDLGVGHPVALRRAVRDCFGLQSSAPVETMDIDEGRGDGEDHEIDDDEQWMDVDLAHEESEDEDDEIEDEEEGESDDGLDDGEEVEEEADELSF
ncbi:uncharacterized protein HD556DRAFT_1446632 [Suillus plorans]|uniref:Uncharacterized protein n=1 Tax=Suillus plorans TaxID=116603 RepID=A0A9P7DEN1_9AGAM|nr:uncharacterized protein HD556DRAFT_1446632 [Suillus plorans]KAG1789842.1 hypothetical protein HD556DRAFT_1446632 [Suillus plorans]